MSSGICSLSQETWQAMEKLVEEGLVRTIGISNFSVKKIQVRFYRFVPGRRNGVVALQC